MWLLTEAGVWKLKSTDLFSPPMFSQMQQNWQMVKSNRVDLIMRNGRYFLKPRISSTAESSHVTRLSVGGVQKHLKETKRVARQEKGELDLFETRIFTKAKAVCLCCPVFVVHAMLPASSPSVCLSSCPAVQNHQLSQWSSPRPVSHDPCPSLDHTKADSVSSAWVCASYACEPLYQTKRPWIVCFCVRVNDPEGQWGQEIT